MDDEINLMDYVRIINKRKRIIIILAVVCGIFALINTMRAPKMYKAEVTLLSMSSGLGGMAQSLSSFGFGGGQSDQATVDSILKSRALARLVAGSYNLDKVVFREKWDEQNLKWIGKEPSVDETASIIKSVLKNGDASRIQTECSDPLIAAAVANAYAKGLIVFLNQKAISVNLQILDEAQPPTGPSNKKTYLNVAIATVFALFIGIFIAFLLEYWDNIKSKIQ